MSFENMPAAKKQRLEEGSVPTVACQHTAAQFVQKISQSEKNPGRAFYSCEECKSFAGWVDEGEPRARKPSPWTKKPATGQARPFVPAAPVQPAPLPSFAAELADILELLRRSADRELKTLEAVGKISDLLITMVEEHDTQ